MTELYFNVAVPTPLRKTFSYRQSPQMPAPNTGSRVLVPFARRKLVGVVTGTTQQLQTQAHKIKSLQSVIDSSPLWPDELWEMLCWAARYYQHPIGEVLATAMPALLREGRPATYERMRFWQLTQTGLAHNPAEFKRAPKQQSLLQLLASSHDHGLPEHSLATFKDTLKRLRDKGLVTVSDIEAEQPFPANPSPASGPTLNREQQQAVATMIAKPDSYTAYLLEGITGSGKTEVYLQCISHCISRGEQALVLVPEIGLTPQMVQRFERRLACAVGVLHSGMSDRHRLQVWLAARDGKLGVILGTRSAIFTPLQKPGLFIVDEEHDTSFKQQDGFRYSARDLAVWRARHNQRPVILGSATPSIESLFNVQQGKFHHVTLTERAGAATPPTLHLIDMRAQPVEQGLSHKLLQVATTHLANDNQVLLFLNRRGFAPTLMCHDCGWVATCQRCDSRMTYHHIDKRLRCHHCGADRHAEQHCQQCQSDQLITLGAGTERIEQVLAGQFPDTAIIRIDRDTTRRKGSLDSLLKQVKHGRRQILIGTQMLAKGHHFPNVTMVGIVDADQGLYSAEFRAPERMAQLILQVAGRAGRAEQPGDVYIQTHQPDHPLLLSLIHHGYNQFAQALLHEREQAGLPPVTAMAIFRAEAVQREAPLHYLAQVKSVFKTRVSAHLRLFGPMPAPMEKRAGRFRAQLILQASDRATLQHSLDASLPAIDTIKAAKVRWSLDVDPLDTY